MKKILFCLLAAMQYASANSCTGLYFQILSNLYLKPNAEFQLDSLSMPGVGSMKYSYAEGKLDNYQSTSYQDNSTTEYKYYWNQDPNKLTKTGYEYLMKDSSSADTTYISEDFYGFGTLGQQRSIKLTSNSMHLVTKSLDFGTSEYSEVILTGDSIVHTTYKGADKESGIHSTTVYVSDSSDSKCYETSSEGDTVSTIKYTSNEIYYSLQIQSDELTANYYFTYTKQGTTAIRKKMFRTSPLPKNRSFDLLGRTVNTKRRF
ncbi:MAG: hypothetical protein IKP90_07795 [Fibrobacter sp.]|nr:hypothetical protein [Fibrobacter sp.]